MDLEGTQGVLVVGGDEHHDREVGRVELPQEREAVHFRHLHVQKQQIGRVVADRLERRSPVGAFADEADVAVVREQTPDRGARGGLVVHDQGADPLAHRWPSHSAGANPNGRAMRASTPPSGAFVTSSS